MKRLLTLAVLFLCCVATSFAFEVDGINYIVSSEDNLTVGVSNGMYSGDVLIPEQVSYGGKTYTVTSICERAFEWCSDVTSVYLPNSILYIGQYAFQGCEGLTSMIIPDKVKTIEDGVFWGCQNLLAISIPDGVWAIKNGAFSGCSRLSTITLPKTLYSILGGAFQDCSSLTNIIINRANPFSISYERPWDDLNLDAVSLYVPSGTKQAFLSAEGWNVFGNIIDPSDSPTDSGQCGSNNMIWSYFEENKSLVISGNGGVDGFYEDDCPWLAYRDLIETVVVYDGVCDLGWDVFRGSKNLKNISLPNSLGGIDEGSFEDCPNLPAIALPCALCYIGRYAFSNCRDLISISLPKSLGHIGDGAFHHCDKLASVTIPKHVDKLGLGSAIFAYCINLVSIKVDTGNTYFDSRDNCNAIIETSTNILHTGCKNTIIPNSVTAIGDRAFESCEELISISIPNSVTSIGKYSFYNCDKLSSIFIPSTVTSLGDGVFRGCHDLHTINLPNSLTTIGEEAFSCTIVRRYDENHPPLGLISITIPNSVTSIGKRAFSLCADLTSVTSLIKEPFNINPNCWDGVNTNEIPLYVPKGTKALYEATEGWNVFKNIIEMEGDDNLTPVNGNGSVDFGGNNDIDNNSNLNGNVIGNIYYSIGDGNGEYSSAEGCIIIRKPVSDSDMSNLQGQDIFGEEFKNGFTGIVFMVHAGSGTIKVNAESVGGMTLKVKVGNNAPFTVELEGKMKVTIPYTVTEPTYIYIYGGGSSAGAPGMGGIATASALKIYGIEWSQSASDINSVSTSVNNDDIIYNMNGQRVWGTPTEKGVYIKNGRKYVVK